MSTDLVLDSSQYISSKRASDITGYSQDYIGQLARGAQIEARRLGGLWHVSMDSLLAYKNKTEDFKPKQPVSDGKTLPDAEVFVHLDGKEYISANRASKITGYNQDYIGQLARSGKILSRQIGNRWYVDKDTLLTHRDQKNALLAAVQRESVGIVADKKGSNFVAGEYDKREPLLTYLNDKGDLLPVIIEERERYMPQPEVPSTHVVAIRVVDVSHRVPIVSRNIAHSPFKAIRYDSQDGVRTPDKTTYRVIFPVFMLTIVVVLSFGLISLKKDSLYTVTDPSHGTSHSIGAVIKGSSLAASAADGFNATLSSIERLLSTELVYKRINKGE